MASRQPSTSGVDRHGLRCAGLLCTVSSGYLAMFFGILANLLSVFILQMHDGLMLVLGGNA